MPRLRFPERAGVLAVAALAACANYTPSITSSEKPSGDEAYLYGRFYIESKSLKLALDGYQTMGFVIKCANGDAYTLRFSNADDSALQVIKIKPSTCSLAEFVYSNADGQVRSRKPAPQRLMHDTTFDAGKAYYLGDFYAATTTTVSGTMIYRNWNVKTIKNDYANTSNALKATYPNLAAMPTEDRMIGR